ncbi:formate/nitrite transporter family protein [Aspergillus ruber CBS 135680]|uniref:Formate/nitrite transporter family protein n=1 Tax=Aspergillus ruber (strain CBS 135680) TaxID=1388766 RepID=A0A017S836_ASPRC|nr:formate/nitrite transporter family protein [Aspergillus ruber CBS 135680]EYE93198.1 formate/nitrite transporter family protein [Aspergillus ruber CBS 135680]
MLDALSPDEVVASVSRIGALKGHSRLDKVFFSSVFAGSLLAFACGTLLSTNAAAWYQDNAGGLIRTLSSLVFPYGLAMIILCGADLCTSSFLFTTVAVLNRKLSWWRMLVHWFVTFWGNLAGSLFVMALIFGYGGVFSADPYKSEVISYANKKQVTPEFHMIFLRGIGCNWLVSMGCYFALQGRDLSSKVMGIWWPIFGFVSLGFDHVVANMTLIPMAIFLGAPEISVGLYIWKGIIPALIGNIVGGALFCSVYFWYMHLMEVEKLPFVKQKQDESQSENGQGGPHKDDIEARAGMISATA